jgi:hypothetical protein
MATLLQVGVSYPHELKSGIGHVACTLGGVNYESRGSRGCIKGSVARSATNPLFRHQFFRVLSDREAQRAKEYADSCVGQPYKMGLVPVPRPKHGGDCSGFVSGIICAAGGQSIERLFATGNWKTVAPRLGFKPGLGGGAVPAAGRIGVLDRPFPGFAIEKDMHKPDHIKWIQSRLNFAAHGHHAVLKGKALDVDGEFGDDTLKVVKAFQKSHGLQGLGMVGPKTWKVLNSVR